MEELSQAFNIAASGLNATHLATVILIAPFLFLSTGIMCLLDFISGIRTARYLGEKIRSRPIRKTIEKITSYWLFQIAGFMVGIIMSPFPFYNLPYVSIVFAIAIIAVEVKSMLEHSGRRKHGSAKIPETIHEIVEWLGEADFKTAIREIARRKVEENQTLP